MQILANKPVRKAERSVLGPGRILGHTDYRYYLAELVFRSVYKITHADWLLNGPIFYDIGPVRFGGKIFELFLMNFKEN